MAVANFERTVCKFAKQDLQFAHSKRDTPSPTSEEVRMGCLPLTGWNSRLLPCRSFVSTGSCCYGARCVFLHDEGLVSKPVFIKNLRKEGKEQVSSDSFFWPMMPTQRQYDGQDYLVTAPHGQSGMNHYAVYSMWEHFLDFLVTDSLLIVTKRRAVPPLNSCHPNNYHTGCRRLRCFQQLSQGMSQGMSLE